MDKYYVIENINYEMKTFYLEQNTKKIKDKLNLTKIPNPPKIKKTMKRNQSRDNFIKYQWPWLI